MRKHQPKRQQQQRSGSALLTSLVMIIMLCMLAAVMIDLGYMYACKSRMQNGADGAALAAAMRIGNDNTTKARAEGRAAAIGFANLNLPDYGDVLVVDDVTFGTWDPDSKTFAVGDGLPNAVQALVRRDGTNTDSVATFFMNIFAVREIGLSVTATVMLSSASGAAGMPIALRAPDFGSIDAKVTEANPGKDGPSPPQNGKSFAIGEEVIVAIYGDGKQSPVHLALDYDAKGPAASEAEVKKIFKGDIDSVDMQVGDEFFVFNAGTGNSSYGEALDDRLDLPANNPGRDIVMPVVETLPNSRNLDGQLTGKIRISDFVSVHLDGIVQAEIEDPNNPRETITVRYLMGTITNRRVETSWGGAAPSGAGGGTVNVPRIVQ